jgi:hypothetical protein
MTFSHSPVTSLLIPDLRAEFDGGVMAPDDAGDDEASIVFPGGMDRRPAVIMRPADAAEVARVGGWCVFC